MTQENKTKEPKQEVMEAAVVEEVAVTEPVEENLLVKRIDETTIMIEEQTYEIVLNYREAFMLKDFQNDTVKFYQNTITS